MYPPYALLLVYEGKNYFNSYMYDKFRETFVSNWKISRQIKHDMVIDTQYFNDIATPFRRITNRFIYLHKPCTEILNSKGECIGHKLYVYEFNNNRDVEIFENTGKKQNCKEYTLVVNMCMYDKYDTDSCRVLYLKDRESQDFRLETFSDISSVDDIEEGLSVTDFAVPEGFYKSKNNGKVKDKSADEDIEDEENLLF